MFATMQLNAQKKIKFEHQKNISSKITKKTGLQKKSPLPKKEPRNLKTTFTTKDGATGNITTLKESNITPDNLLSTQGWGELKNTDTNQYQLYQMDSQFSEGSATTTIKLLDENNITPTKEFTLELPATANYAGTLGEITSQVGENPGLRKLLVYVHFFEGGTGPDYQKNQVWVVTENGDIQAKLDAVVAYFNTDENGNKQIVTYDASEEKATIKILDNQFHEKKTVDIPEELLNYYLGDPIRFINIKGENKIVLSHFEKVFMNNDTLEVTPDNHLLIDIYDLDLNLENTYKTDISTVFPDSPYTIPQVQFGVFVNNGIYDITDKTFNQDDQLEFFYQIVYYDLMADKSWTYNYVGNEAGERILSYEQPILEVASLNSIDGQEDQVAFLLTSLEGGEKKKDEEGGQPIEMFNLASWNTQFSFPAEYEGQLLSSSFNRIPTADDYNYIIALGEGLLENETAYGIINQYSKTGEFERDYRLNLGTNPYTFMPLLSSDYLNPTLYNNDADYEFTYIHKHLEAKTATLYNTVSIAKDRQEPLFYISGSSDEGDLIGSGFVVNKAGDQKIKLAIVHEPVTGNQMLTKFFNIPFQNLATQNNLVSNLQVYTDDLNKIVGWTEKATQYEIYDLVGRTVKKGAHASFTSTVGLPKGMYIVKLSTPKGNITKKFMVK